MTAQALPGLLARRLDRLPPGELVLGFSGGLDSSVLLHLLAASTQARVRGLRAVHVDHGLHAASNAWAQHCRNVADALDVPLEVERVQVPRDSGLGIEAAARVARHAAFSKHVGTASILVLAQHRDDQVETVLLRLLHAAGHEGVAGMRDWRRFGDGSLWRPLLDQPRALLEAWARTHVLAPIEDPSNADPTFARNRLRHRVLPALRAAWPDADTRIAASAARLREDSDALDAIARESLARLRGAEATALALPPLRAMPLALRRRVIGMWLDDLALPRPPPGIWRRLEIDLLDARIDATPLLAWRGAELRRYRDTLYALRERPPAAADWCIAWTGEHPVALPAGFGHFALDPPQAFDTPLSVAPRRGGETLLQHGLRRPLRLRLQELAVPPWQRERLPLLFDAGGALLAVADLAFADSFAQWQETRATRLRWTRDD